MNLSVATEKRCAPRKGVCRVHGAQLEALTDAYAALSEAHSREVDALHRRISGLESELDATRSAALAAGVEVTGSATAATVAVTSIEYGESRERVPDMATVIESLLVKAHAGGPARTGSSVGADGHEGGGPAKVQPELAPAPGQPPCTTSDRLDADRGIEAIDCDRGPAWSDEESTAAERAAARAFFAEGKADQRARSWLLGSR